MSSEALADNIFHQAAARITHRFSSPSERAAAWAALRERIERVEELEQEVRVHDRQS